MYELCSCFVYSTCNVDCCILYMTVRAILTYRITRGKIRNTQESYYFFVRDTLALLRGSCVSVRENWKNPGGGDFQFFSGISGKKSIVPQKVYSTRRCNLGNWTYWFHGAKHESLSSGRDWRQLQFWPYCKRPDGVAQGEDSLLSRL